MEIEVGITAKKYIKFDGFKNSNNVLKEFIRIVKTQFNIDGCWRPTK